MRGQKSGQGKLADLDALNMIKFIYGLVGVAFLILSVLKSLGALIPPTVEWKLLIHPRVGEAVELALYQTDEACETDRQAQIKAAVVQSRDALPLTCVSTRSLWLKWIYLEMSFDEIIPTGQRGNLLVFSLGVSIIALCIAELEKKLYKLKLKDELEEVNRRLHELKDELEEVNRRLVR